MTTSDAKTILLEQIGQYDLLIDSTKLKIRLTKDKLEKYKKLKQELNDKLKHFK